MTNEDIRAVEQALGAIRLIRDWHASSKPGHDVALEILKALRGDGKSLFRVNMADAINATIENKAVEPVTRRAA
jgi:hypothetical protein